jgi:hypothetical protein
MWRLADGLAPRVLVLVVSGACSAQRGPVDVEAARGLFETLPLDVPPGMSDLAVDDHGTLWAVAERARAVAKIDLVTDVERGAKPAPNTLIAVLRIVGIPDGFDTEAITWLEADRFAIGTEGTNEAAAEILTAELREGAIVVTGRRALAERELGVKLTINHGVEALCGRDGELLAAIEAVGTHEDGRRWAPIVRVRGAVHDGEVEVARLWLTSRKGKISALHCTLDGEGTATVTAIERHFGVARILAFELRRGDSEVTPRIVHDLHPVLQDAYNLEGVARLRDGRLVLINDNQSRTVSGPTQLFLFHRP